MKNPVFITSLFVAISLSLFVTLAFIILRPQQPNTTLSDGTLSDRSIDSLKDSIDANSVELQRIRRDLAELIAIFSRTTSSPNITSTRTVDSENGKEANKEDELSTPAAESNIPPSAEPFYDYDTLPPEFLPLVGENEIFMLMEDGRRLARLSLPVDFSLRKDIETRNTAEELLLAHLELSELEDDWETNILTSGRYSFFETFEEVQTFLSNNQEDINRYIYRQVPDSEGYAVMDRSEFLKSPQRQDLRKRIKKLTLGLGARSSRVGFVELPKKGSKSSTTPFADKANK